MIDAKELRSGNLLIGNPISIPRLGIYTDGTIAVTEHGIVDIAAGVWNLLPIPLSNEWMLRLGFKKGNSMSNQRFIWETEHQGIIYRVQINPLLNKCIPMCGAMGIYQPRMENVPSPTNEDLKRTTNIEESLVNFAFHIKYVHELQNLFFALTGTELIVGKNSTV